MNEEFNFDKFTLEKKAINAKMPSAMNFVLVIIVVIAALVSLGEFTLTVSSVVNVSLIVAVLYVITSIMYKNSYLDGIEKGKLEAEYIAVKEEYDSVIKQIYDNDVLTKLPELCLRYRQEDLKNSRTGVLIDACISYETYEKEYFGKSEEDIRKMDLSEEAIKCILAANKVKGINITPGALMSTGEDVSIADRLLAKFGVLRGFGIESKTRLRIDFTANMISRAITTTLAGAIGINVVMDDFSLKTIALWAMKMLPVAMAVLNGHNSGLRNVRETLTTQLQRKTKIIKILLAWHKEEKHPREIS